MLTTRKNRNTLVLLQGKDEQARLLSKVGEAHWFPTATICSLAISWRSCKTPTKWI